MTHQISDGSSAGCAHCDSITTREVTRSMMTAATSDRPADARRALVESYAAMYHTAWQEENPQAEIQCCGVWTPYPAPGHPTSCPGCHTTFDAETGPVPAHNCPRDEFLADPITVAYGVGSEMISLIGCAICDLYQTEEQR